VSITGGEINLGGVNLLTVPERDMNVVRGGRIGMVAQDPMVSLNPTKRIGFQIAEGPRIHLGLGRREAMAIATALLSEMGIPRAAQRVRDYPHQFSGGMRQRVGIAMAVAAAPEVLIADEPTTALDVTIQAQILELLLDLRDRRGLAVLFITHDLGVASRICDDISVMYAGQIVESGAAAEVLERPRMPYTSALVEAVPILGRLSRPGPMFRTGDVAPHSRGTGCRFAPRCPHARERCNNEVPLIPISAEHLVRCHGVAEGWL
jgi:oligopeptide/dipeptide ABC transporter ATP-binding protein